MDNHALGSYAHSKSAASCTRGVRARRRAIPPLRDQGRALRCRLDRVAEEIAETAADRARQAPDPAARLKAGCGAWLEMTLERAIQRIVLLDAAAVSAAHACGRSSTATHSAACAHNLERLAEQNGGLDADVDLLAHMVLAAVNEAALFIVRATDPPAALAVGRQAVSSAGSHRILHDGCATGCLALSRSERSDVSSAALVRTPITALCY